jgi:hypothetical protein
MRTWPRSKERTTGRSMRRDGTGDDQSAGNLVTEIDENITLEDGAFLLWE